MFKYFYDGKRISMENFISQMEFCRAHDFFIEWEYNVMNFPGITEKTWCWGFYMAKYLEDKNA